MSLENKLENMIVESEGNKYGFVELNNLLGNTTKFLKQCGFKEGSKIPVLCDDGLHVLMITLAAISINACVALIENKKREREIEEILGLLDLSFILTDVESLKIPGVNEIVFDLKTIENETYSENMFPKLEKENQNNHAVIIFSSGSSGNPKGIIRDQKNVFSHASALGAALLLKEKEQVLHLAPFYHAYGFEHIMAAIYSGCNNKIYNVFDFHSIIKALKSTANVVIGVPYQYELLLKKKEKIHNSKLRLLVSASAPLKENVAIQSMTDWNVNITQLYGSSELSASIVNMDSKSSKSVGKPIKNILIKINEEKELLVKSPYICKGYINNEYKLNIENGWFHTGDIATIDNDGCVYIEGRLDNLINISGKKVSPEEIEKVISSIKGVKEVYVYAEHHDVYGAIIVAQVVCTDLLTETEILSFCREKLVEYMVPAVVNIVDSISHTSNGKIKRVKEKV